MTRLEMQNVLIKRFGHEHPYVIQFISLCEEYPPTNWNNACLSNIYKAYIKIQECENQLK